MVGFRVVKEDRDGNARFGKSIAADGSVSDGGGANPATGYSLIEADSLDAAVKLAKGCPVLGGGATIEVAETFNVM